jgi:uncharacterized membrane protein
MTVVHATQDGQDELAITGMGHVTPCVFLVLDQDQPIVLHAPMELLGVKVDTVNAFLVDTLLPTQIIPVLLSRIVMITARIVHLIRIHTVVMNVQIMLVEARQENVNVFQII